MDARTRKARAAMSVAATPTAVVATGVGVVPSAVAATPARLQLDLPLAESAGNAVV